jgi:hypothetical protein
LARKAEEGVEAAKALVDVFGNSPWEAVALAHGYLRLQQRKDQDAAARVAYEMGAATLTASRELLKRAVKKGFLTVLQRRDRTGSAENPVTKLFPAAITEQRFLELLDDLCAARKGLRYSDDRQAGHSLTDFTLREGELELPVNVKNAGTRFEKAAELVGLDPNDCIPIPAYKAYGAVAKLGPLIYVISVDYELIRLLDSLLPELFDEREKIAWALLNSYAGARVRKAEDAFVSRIVKRHWDKISAKVRSMPFHVVSARKAIRILQTMPQRTPGIGLRAWGTGASAEVNVHLSIGEDTKPWRDIADRIRLKGVSDIVSAVNRKKTEVVYDPEI